MSFCSQRQQFPFAIACIITVFVAIAPLTNAAAPQHVTWQWPLVDVGPGAADAHSYNAVDIVNASWTSNLDFQPNLVVWCASATGFTASTQSLLEEEKKPTPLHTCDLLTITMLLNLT